MGFYVGPNKEEHQWSEVRAKILTRLQGWGWGTFGLHFSTVIYNSYLASVAGFKLQLAELDDLMTKLEAHAMHKAVPGVGMGFMQQDLWQLGDTFGLPHNFANLAETSLAARARIYVADSLREEGPLLPGLRRELEEARRTTQEPQREHDFRRWLDLAPAAVVYRAVDTLRAEGIDPKQVYRDARDGASGGDAAKRADEAKRSIQRRILVAVRRRSVPDMHYRIRDRLARWNLMGVPRATAEEFRQHAETLRKAAPPRVRAAVLSTAWNRWTTERRFQRRGGAANHCVFGCGGEAEDSLEHYARCGVLRAVHWRHLRIGPDSTGSLLPKLILGRDLADKKEKTRAALGAYASFRAYNLQKHGAAVPKEEVHESFGQFLREGAMGHQGAETALTTTWANSRGDTTQQRRKRRPQEAARTPRPRRG